LLGSFSSYKENERNSTLLKMLLLFDYQHLPLP
jgi:hypothetical protein